MDISFQYIKMCQRASEIQKLWKPRWGDFIWDEESGLAFPISSVRIEQETCAWLPRQDQLQGMVWDAIIFIGKIEGCAKYYWDSRPHSSTIDTPEKLWLAFVMHEKYQKEWDGKDWLKKT